MNLRESLLQRLWYVHPTLVLTVQAAPVECLKALMMAAKPSTRRLHLRNLFAEGRRYFVQPRENGFKLTSSSKIPWRRGRTAIAAIVLGGFSDMGGGGTRIELRAQMRWFFFLDIFLIPSFVASLVIFAPWPYPAIAAAMVALYTLSWVWHRLTAALQAAEMFFFVQKALEDLTPYQTPALSGAAAEVVTPDFREAWEKFYRQQRDKDDPGAP